MAMIAAGGLAAALGGLSGLHLFWAIRGPRAGFAIPSVDGRPLFRPSRLGTLAVAAGLAGGAAVNVAALCFMAAGRHAPGLAVAEAALASAFFLRFVGDFRYVGVGKRVRGTPFARWDDWLFSPLCFAFALAGARVAWALWRVT